MYVCNAPSNRFFFFVSRWNRAIFWPLVLRDPLYKTLFFDFWFGPPNPQNLTKIFIQLAATLMKFCHIKRDHHYTLKMANIGWNAHWVVLRDPLYKTLFFDFWFGPLNPKNLTKIFIQLAATLTNSACMADRPEMFAPNRGFSGIADWMEPYKMLSGRPLLPWQRKFGLLFHKNRFFLVCRWNRAIFGPSVLHVALYKTSFLIRLLI